MSFNYSNTEIIFSNNGTVFGDLFSQNDHDLIFSKTVELPADNIDNKVIEFHVYDVRGNLLLSDHNVSVDTWRTSLQSPADVDHFPAIILDSKSHFNNFDVKQGRYKIVYNFFVRKLGTENNPLFIKTISPSRTEIRLLPFENTEDYIEKRKNVFGEDVILVVSADRISAFMDFIMDLLKEVVEGDEDQNVAAAEINRRIIRITKSTIDKIDAFMDFIRTLLDNVVQVRISLKAAAAEIERKINKEYSRTITVGRKKYRRNYVLNLNNNIIIPIVNSVLDRNSDPSETSIILKLYNPLPDNIVEKNKVGIVEEFSAPAVTCIFRPCSIGEISFRTRCL